MRFLLFSALFLVVSTGSLTGCGKTDGVGEEPDTSPQIFETGSMLDYDNDGVESDVDCDDFNAQLGDISDDADCDGSLAAVDCDDSSPDLFWYDLDGDGLDDACGVRDISVGYNFACAVLSSRKLSCWGDNTYRKAEPPEGEYVSVAAGYQHACATDLDGQVDCWGNNGVGQGEPPTDVFRQISSGEGLSCGIRPDDTGACWGSSDYGLPVEIAGQIKTISVGSYSVCALLVGDIVSCWGNTDYGITVPPTTSYKQVAVSRQVGCGLNIDNAVSCWGSDAYSYSTEGVRGSKLTVGSSVACLIDGNKRITCFGPNDQYYNDSPQGEFEQVDSGHSFSCAITVAGLLQCWGDNTYHQLDPTF